MPRQITLRCWNCWTKTFDGKSGHSLERVISDAAQEGWTREPGPWGELSRCPECQGQSLKPVQAPVDTPCSDCEGHGRCDTFDDEGNEIDEPCYRCKGTGVEPDLSKGRGVPIACSTCKGTGATDDGDECYSCQGTGLFRVAVMQGAA